MRNRSSVLLSLLLAASCVVAGDAGWRGGPTGHWFVNWDKALAEAKKTGKALFVLKTGSDWCYWCKKLHAEILEQPSFVQYAKENLVLVYLDSPNRNPLGAEQNRHNRRIIKALPFGGGVPNVVLMSADGKMLGTIYGGGLALDAYLEKVRAFRSSEGEPVKGEDAALLFSKGYGALAEKIDARLAALPPATEKDFKTSVSGMAISQGVGISNAETAKYKGVEEAIDVPFGQSLVFRIEYEIPEGYGARIFVQPMWESDQRQNYQRFDGNNASVLYKGKGVAYSYMKLKDSRCIGRLKSVAVRVLPDPEFDEVPYGWTKGVARVDVGFQSAEGGSEPSTPVSMESFDDRKWQKGPDRLWFVNWEKAVAEAKKTGKKLFVLNTGSDWCGWCKKLKADVLSSNKFKAFARNNLVLVYLDNPRQNPLPNDQQRHNNQVISRLTFGGGVPCAKIIDSDGTTERSTISGYKPEKEYLRAVREAVGKK